MKRLQAVTRLYFSGGGGKGRGSAHSCQQPARASRFGGRAGNGSLVLAGGQRSAPLPLRREKRRAGSLRRGRAGCGSWGPVTARRPALPAVRCVLSIVALTGSVGAPRGREVLRCLTLWEQKFTSPEGQLAREGQINPCVDTRLIIYFPLSQ